MARAHFRIIFAFLALALLAGAGLGIYWFWKNQIEPARLSEQRIRALENQPAPPPDHGVAEFMAARSLLQNGETVEASLLLKNLMRHYKDSDKFSEAKRIIGEINMDTLLSTDPMPGKFEHIVKRGDSLNGIAAKHDTTVQYILQVNNLLGSMLHPGEQLLVCKLDFRVVIQRGEGTLRLLMRHDGGESFFKEYPIIHVRMPPGLPMSFDAVVKKKSAWNNGRTVATSDSSRFTASDKWIQCERTSGSKKSFTMRSPGDEDLKDEYTIGVFLAEPDIEELNTLLRTGSPVLVRE